MKNNETFYVTTPIYYVNDKPHIGHAYTTVLADVLARYNRLLERPTFFLTGTDEHGQKVYEAAKENGISPLEHCNKTVERFLESWRELNITYDDFIRTTEDRHAQVVQKILQQLFDQGEIYQGEYAGWYCVPCERFFTEKDLNEGNCPECGRGVEKLVEKNYFFRMSQYQDWLIQYITDHPEFIQPEHRRQETLGFLKKPLGDLCISRPKERMEWGIELPFDNEYVTYVWFDALINYISAVGYMRDSEQFEEWWPATYHLIGKDILTTHSVYWPTMLKAVGVEMPRTIFAHGWWLVDQSKMSKSAGNVVNPMEAAEIYGVDAFRYFVSAEMTLGQDANFTEEIFLKRYNSDLANDLGNLASRVIKMIRRNAGGKIPGIDNTEATQEETELKNTCLKAVKDTNTHLDNLELDKALSKIMEAVREANRYFEKMEPWHLARADDEASQNKLNRVLYNTAECLRIVSGLFFPVMPTKMNTLRHALNVGSDADSPRLSALEEWGGLPANVEVADVKSLFPRVNTKKEDQRAKGGSEKKQQEKKSSSTGLVDISEFGKLELKTARILEAESVEGADKLLKLKVDIGQEERQLVAGIAKAYSQEALIGKNIVVVTNLKPAEIRGSKSEGMLLAAQNKEADTLTLITPDTEDIPPGSKIQ